MAPNEDKYQGQYPVDVQVGDKQLRVTVHFASVKGQITCVGLDIRSFTSPVGFNPPEDWARVVPIGGEWTTITSPLMRGVRVAEAIQVAAEGAESLIRRLLSEMTGESWSAEDLGVTWAQPESEPRKRRGPKPLLDDALLRDVVASAYRTAPSKPVQAVQAAMVESIPAYKGRVTPDMARKAVAAARARGFIPPAKSKRQDRSSR